MIVRAFSKIIIVDSGLGSTSSPTRLLAMFTRAGICFFYESGSEFSRTVVTTPIIFMLLCYQSTYFATLDIIEVLRVHADDVLC